MARKNMNSSYHTNREMNKDTYKLRTLVMKYVYEAKALVPNLPRIEIRVTDCDRHTVLGTARLGDCVVWIPAKTLNRSEQDIRHVVFHEILHAAYNVKHINTCPLMGPIINKTTKSQVEKLFVKYAK